MAVNLKMIEPDVLCATKFAIDKGLSNPIGDDDLNQQSCLPLMAKDDDKNLIVLENERLENELSLLQSQLTDSSSKLKMFQNVHDELATTKNELEEKKREMTDMTPLPDCGEGNRTAPKNFQIKFVRGVNLPEAKDNYYVSIRVDVWLGMIHVHSKKHKTKTIRGSQPQWNKDLTSIKTQNPEKWMLTIKVKKSSIFGLKTSTVGFVKLDMYSLENGLNKLQLYDESHNPVGKSCLELEIKIEYPLTEVIPSPEIVSKPKDTLAEITSSNVRFEMDKKRPEPESLSDNLQKTIDDTGNVTNKDPVLSETDELLEMAEETIIPEVEQQPTKAQSKTTDNQPRLITKDPHASPPNPEKSQLVQNGAMDEKREATEPLPDCEEGNRKPKNFQIKVVRGVNFPEAKDSDKYYVSIQVEEWHGMIRDQVKKIKTKIIGGSQPEWNQKFTIKTRNQEGSMMTFKVKKSSKSFWKTSSITVGSAVIYLSCCDDSLTHLRLFRLFSWVPDGRRVGRGWAEGGWIVPGARRRGDEEVAIESGTERKEITDRSFEWTSVRGIQVTWTVRAWANYWTLATKMSSLFNNFLLLEKVNAILSAIWSSRITVSYRPTEPIRNQETVGPNPTVQQLTHKKLNGNI
ncbi:hypothetical protein DAPPUDRAFT_108774 [Daphnia pulex]|uniref:C2 domain-containing protein n=1 Tax=Daphnia pulex TaxID=6669 RepID=E9H150_DAPPU|nr:hypothetical protein DAPPUDRAFT_108774 [Daphnia pulex]|eukprot:EFX74572.1 hypothetical protein DAPPUDRAFT_108774 [Daphnia pulex]